MLAQLAAGLVLFLFGLQLLTSGLKAIAGAAITALLNSSTITTVLLVGFVSAGLMTLGQTVPMIMGANIGSTFTAQIIAFNVSALTPIMLALGFVGYAFGHREILRELGEVVLGFGLLFLGIQFMGDSSRSSSSSQRPDRAAQADRQAQPADRRECAAGRLADRLELVDAGIRLQRQEQVAVLHHVGPDVRQQPDDLIVQRPRRALCARDRHRAEFELVRP